MLEIIGFALALLIGVSLGLIGGGGSTLAVPILVYLIGVSPVIATGYSLFIIGSTSLVGGIRYAKKGLVDYKTAALFGIPSIVSVYFTRKVIVPVIPEEIFEIAGFALSKGMMLMMLFALLMIIAAYGMIKPSTPAESKSSSSNSKLVMVVLGEGLIVGFLTGLVGAGGGFLIIPALVLFSGLSMKRAVGTSLLIISAKSLIGFIGDVGNYSINWPFLLIFSGLAIVGIFIGSFLSTKVDGAKLKTGFGWFVLLMGIAILTAELI
ncbi:sulfite exporter TauE/SafE family protein [Salibacteraceae bacterium]|nr:sulfite exporter TauE/SafE family protein [Flavobacteriales bacterium]MDB9701224.1 sulfite exporter TauE/SafE family protein [Salibacteraceae bacterium]